MTNCICIWKKKQNCEDISRNRDGNEGGLGFNTAEELTYVCLEDFSFVEPEIECISIKVRFANVGKIIVNAYRRPGTDSTRETWTYF